jgi:HNH endonuclease/NUMOD4 motif
MVTEHMEIYKPILGYEGYYWISNLGNVKSKYKQLKLAKSTWGYAMACVSMKNKKRSPVVHRMVWQAFNGKIEKGMQVNHINGDKLDNRLCNLEVITARENTIHSIKTGLRKTVKTGAQMLTREDVAAIKFFYTQKRGTTKILCKIFNRHRSSIRGIAIGSSLSHY